MMANGKRVISFMLAICLLFSVLPPIVLATATEEQAQEPVTVIYDFALEKTELVTTSGASFENAQLCGSAVSGAISAYYNDETLNWKYVTNNSESFRDGTNTVSEMLYFGGDTNPWSGLRFGFRVVPGIDNNSYPAGYWTAFTLKSPGTGNYRISLDYQTRKDGSAGGAIYIIKGTFTDKDALEAAMTNENLRQVVDFSSNSADFSDIITADLGVMAFGQGEYTIVFKATQGSAAGAYMHISSLTFEASNQNEQLPDIDEEDIPKEATPQGYSFAIGSSDLVNSYGSAMAGTLLTNKENLDALEQYYADNMVSWKFALDNLDSLKTETNTVSNTYYLGGNSSYKYKGLRLGVMIREGEERSYPAGYWTAFTIKSPRASTYELTLNYQTRSDGTPAGEVYLIKGTFTDAKKLEAQMTKDNLLKVVEFTSNKGEFEDASRNLGVVTFENCEYTLVFKATQAKQAGAYMHITDLQFVKTEPKPVLGPVQKNEVVYDFQLGSSKFVATDGTELAGQILSTKKVADALEDYYADQKIYWKYAADNVTSFKKDDNKVSSTFYIGNTDKYKWSGIRFGLTVTGPEVDPETGKTINTYPYGYWTALNIHAPGSGLYYLSLDYQIRADATTAAEIYLIKGSLNDPAQSGRRYLYRQGIFEG